MLPRRRLALIFLATLLTSIPYALAPGLTEPGAEFGGFLINPIDGFSYLAKMRQGGSDSFAFQLPYAAEPGPGSTLFAFHLALGWLTAITGLQPIVAYHAARAVGTVLMFVSASLFFDKALGSRSASQMAFVLALFASGLGGLGIRFGLLAIDLWVPEAIPIFSAFANAHFPYACAALLLSVSAISFELFSPGWRALAAFGGGLLLAITQPFAAASIGLVLAIWIGIDNQGRLRNWLHDRRAHALLAFGSAALPVVLYAYVATASHPALSLWAGQNITPSPSLIETLLGYGVLLPAAIVAVVRRTDSRPPIFRLLLIWVAVNGVLLYAPIPLQRRLTLGLFFPLAGLAALGIKLMSSSVRRQRMVLAIAIGLSVPSHAFVMVEGLRAVAGADPRLILVPGERATYRWLEQHGRRDSVVLGAPLTGNRIPSFSSLRVIYGHPFETPSAESSEETIRELYGWQGRPAEGLARLRATEAELVVYGPNERQFGEPTWLADTELVFESDQFQVYRVADG